MPIYIAMLRAVNLGPHNRMKMDQFRQSMEKLGFEQVQTYIQSGNAIFKTPQSSPIALTKKLEEKILADFGLSISVVLRTSAEMGKVIGNNPFLKRRGIDPTKLHITFLSQPPAEAGLKKIATRDTGPDEFRCSGSEIYLYCPQGYGRTKLSNLALEKLLVVHGTTRNWNTVNKLYEMSVQCS
jgi:uncharacterized protein (DUF1697 family)